MPEKLEGRAIRRTIMALSLALGTAVLGAETDISNNNAEVVEAAEFSAQSYGPATPMEIEKFEITTTTQPTTTTTEAPTTTTTQPPPTTTTEAPPPPPAKVSGAPAEWMVAAGIPPENYDEVDYIMDYESDWFPGAVNDGGCIGLGQACPGGIRSELEARCPDWPSQPVCQLVVFQDYAYSRYGGWEGSVAHSSAKGWW
jgi:hypothetical protein